MNKLNDQQTSIQGVNMTPKPTLKPFNPPNVVLTSIKRNSGANKRKTDAKHAKIWDSDYSSHNSEAN